MNAAAPINRIPQELLSNIFALSPGTISHGSGTRGLAYWPFEEVNVGDLPKLTKVCRYWRDLAVATPMLWNTVCTYFGDDRYSQCFRRSIYLPDDPSPDLIVHFDPDQDCTGKMVEFVVTNAPKIRELHAWNMYVIPDVPSFLRSLDASALEHCTLWDSGAKGGALVRQPSPKTRFLPFFSNDGARLRSLSLANFHILPTNDFPALTLFLIASEYQSLITTGDLVKFLAGCPRLEEVYVYNIQQCPSHPPPASPLISLPRLQYLSYAYRRHQRFGWEEGADPIEYLLSRTSIPSTCHMYFTVHNGPDLSVTNRGILDTVCRHVHGKDAVSHLFIGQDESGQTESRIQLVFSQGSLRLHLPPFDHLGIFHSFPGRLFSSTEELRIRYTTILSHPTDSVRTLTSALPATFPNVKVLSIIPKIRCSPGNPLLHLYLAQPCQSASAGVPETSRIPHPALDTLWISVQSREEIPPLKATLAARASLGFPIRCLIVHHVFWADPEALAQLQTLGAEEVIPVTEVGDTNIPTEVDLVVRIPDTFSLPTAIHRDWPTNWYTYRREK
ncbi:hypothetical protein LXA43DRAFT_588365 [Ganoderma leucocontextum]|nr:hypothetical protein LXA43DRAFT_588365 [Ganoderma leucocontextum]